MNDQAPTTNGNTTENYPIQVQVEYPEKSSRLLAISTLILFFKMILLIPHLIILYFLGLFSFIAAIAAQFYILVKGVYPPNLFALVKGVSIWQLRINGYMLGLTDKYPPLTFDQVDTPKAVTALKKIVLGIVIFFVVIVVLILLSSN